MPSAPRRLGLGKVEQLAAYTRPLSVWSDGYVVEQEAVWSVLQYQNPGNLARLVKDPHLSRGSSHSVVVKHRTWWRPDHRDIMLIGA